MPLLDLDHRQLEYKIWGTETPEILMLHDGLGSMAQWGSVPGDVASKTGKTVLSYNRPGHGESTPVPSGRWPRNWMQDQARLASKVLEAFNIESTYVIGHSDGASIALILAATERAKIRGVAAFSPHSYVEKRCVDAITKLRDSPDFLLRALDRFHRDAAATFGAWSGGWVADDFETWDIRSDLAKITCPALVAQGSIDEYATIEMLNQTVSAIGGGVINSPNAGHAVAASTAAERHLLEGLGHMLFAEAPEFVVSLVADFVTRVDLVRAEVS